METYDEIDKRMSSTLGASAGIQSVAGTIGSRPKVPPVKPKKNIDSDFDDFSLVNGAGGGGTGGHPFKPNPASGAATVTFEPGTITNAGQNISPTVGGGSTMATVPRPSLTITVTGTIYLEATVDAAGAATSIDTKNAATTPTDTSTLKYLTLANVTKSGSTVTVTGRPVRESRTLYICSGTAIWD